MPVNVSDLVGVPFVPRGRDPHTGLDCWGLVMVVCARFGHPLPDLGHAPDTGLPLVSWQTRAASLFTPAPDWSPIRPLLLSLPGDEGSTIHTAVLLPGDTVIHATRRAGVIVEPYHRLHRRVTGRYFPPGGAL